MNKDQAIGAVILVASIAGLIVYGWLLYAYPIVLLQITAFVLVAAGLVILAWIGWTMTTTPPPARIESEPMTTETGTSPGLETISSQKDSAERRRPAKRSASRR